jgi:hypothetical protein
LKPLGYVPRVDFHLLIRRNPNSLGARRIGTGTLEEAKRVILDHVAVFAHVFREMWDSTALRPVSLQV